MTVRVAFFVLFFASALLFVYNAPLGDLTDYYSLGVYGRSATSASIPEPTQNTKTPLDITPRRPASRRVKQEGYTQRTEKSGTENDGKEKPEEREDGERAEAQKWEKVEKKGDESTRRKERPANRDEPGPSRFRQTRFVSWLDVDRDTPSPSSPPGTPSFQESKHQSLPTLKPTSPHPSYDGLSGPGSDHFDSFVELNMDFAEPMNAGSSPERRFFEQLSSRPPSGVQSILSGVVGRSAIPAALPKPKRKPKTPFNITPRQKPSNPKLKQTKRRQRVKKLERKEEHIRKKDEAKFTDLRARLQAHRTSFAKHIRNEQKKQTLEAQGRAYRRITEVSPFDSPVTPLPLTPSSQKSGNQLSTESGAFSPSFSSGPGSHHSNPPKGARPQPFSWVNGSVPSLSSSSWSSLPSQQHSFRQQSPEQRSSAQSSPRTLVRTRSALGRLVARSAIPMPSSEPRGKRPVRTQKWRGTFTGKGKGKGKGRQKVLAKGKKSKTPFNITPRKPTSRQVRQRKYKQSAKNPEERLKKKARTARRKERRQDYRDISRDRAINERQRAGIRAYNQRQEFERTGVSPILTDTPPNPNRSVEPSSQASKHQSFQRSRSSSPAPSFNRGSGQRSPHSSEDWGITKEFDQMIYNPSSTGQRSPGQQSPGQRSSGHPSPRTLVRTRSAPSKFGSSTVAAGPGRAGSS